MSEVAKEPYVAIAAPAFTLGARIMMASPGRAMIRGREDGVRLVIPNGSLGTIAGISGNTSVVCTFDGLGGAVGVGVPIHWLRLAPGELAS